MITVIQPDPKVTLDRFADWLEEDYEVVPPTPRLEDCGDKIIVLGGTMNAVEGEEWLPAMRELLVRAVRANIPVLGICLGHQILATAFGGEVAVGTVKEDGAFEVRATPAGRDDPLLRVMGEKSMVAESHNDGVVTLPEGAVLLASSDACIQAFRIGSAVGVQFHPEVSPATMGEWATWTGHDREEMQARMEGVDKQVASFGRALAQEFSR